MGLDQIQVCARFSNRCRRCCIRARLWQALIQWSRRLTRVAQMLAGMLALGRVRSKRSWRWLEEVPLRRSARLGEFQSSSRWLFGRRHPDGAGGRGAGIQTQVVGSGDHGMRCCTGGGRAQLLQHALLVRAEDSAAAEGGGCREPSGNQTLMETSVSCRRH